MGFFDSSDPKVTVIDPLAKQKTKAADFLVGALETPDFRPGEVVPLAANEQKAQEALAGLLGRGVSPERQGAIESISQMLAEPADITATPEFRAILEAVNKGTDDRVNQAIQRTKIQLGGVTSSNVQESQVGRELAAGRTAQVAALAPYAEGERNRRLGMSDLLSRLVGEGDAATLSRVGAGVKFGQEPRLIDQREKDEQFAAMMQRLMFPSTYGANISGTILNSNIDTAIQPGDRSMFAQMAPIIGTVGGALIGGMGAGAPGSSGNPSVATRLDAQSFGRFPTSFNTAA